MTAKARTLLVVLGVGLALDQATKAWTRTLGPRDRVVVIPDWLEFVHRKNPGAAFSMLADSPYRLHFFAVFTVVAVSVLVWAWKHCEPEDRWTSGAIGLFLVGAIGNAIDRAVFHHVTDFVQVYAGRHGPAAWRALHESWFNSDIYPIWNVADAAIVVAIPLYLLPLFFRKDPTETADDEGPTREDPLKGTAGEARSS